MPQVEVTFDIDANGILHVSAKDKATGKEQKIVIKACSGLSEDEIKRMVGDAEAHAEEDKKFRELVEARNHADALVHAAEKSLKDLGDKVGGEDRAKAESALADLRRALKGDDKAAIEKKSRGAGRGVGCGASRSRPMRPAGRCGRRRRAVPAQPARSAATTSSMPSSRK